MGLILASVGILVLLFIRFVTRLLCASVCSSIKRENGLVEGLVKEVIVVHRAVPGTWHFELFLLLVL